MTQNRVMQSARKRRDKKLRRGKAAKDPRKSWWYDSDKYLQAKHTDRDLDAKKKARSGAK